MSEQKPACQIVVADLVVIWSLKEGAKNPLTGYEVIAGRVQKCVTHGQDAIFCALGHQPQKWDGAVPKPRLGDELQLFCRNRFAQPGAKQLFEVIGFVAEQLRILFAPGDNGRGVRFYVFLVDVFEVVFWDGPHDAQEPAALKIALELEHPVTEGQHGLFLLIEIGDLGEGQYIGAR